LSHFSPFLTLFLPSGLFFTSSIYSPSALLTPFSHIGLVGGSLFLHNLTFVAFSSSWSLLLVFTILSLSTPFGVRRPPWLPALGCPFSPWSLVFWFSPFLFGCLRQGTHRSPFLLLLFFFYFSLFFSSLSLFGFGVQLTIVIYVVHHI
jgi:hypothetical protein